MNSAGRTLIDFEKPISRRRIARGADSRSYPPTQTIYVELWPPTRPAACPSRLFEPTTGVHQFGGASSDSAERFREWIDCLPSSCALTYEVAIGARAPCPA